MYPLAPALRLLALLLMPLFAHAEPMPQTRIETDYLGRLYAPLEPPQVVDQGLLIFHPRSGGSLAGKVNAALLAPGGDWMRIAPDGTMRIDVRLSARLDDGALLYMSYGGVLRKPDASSWSRFQAGERIEAPAWYYVIAPTFETSSAKYGWLNGVQAVGKFVSIQTGRDAHIAFDLYLIR